MNRNERILFYDGDCGFCNRAVSFVLKKDKTATIKFSSLQSEFAQHLLTENGRDSLSLDTIVLVDDGVLYDKSNAAIQLCKYFSWPWKPLVLFKIVPRILRDFVYDMIAKNRKRLAKPYCVLDSSSQKSRFI